MHETAQARNEKLLQNSLLNFCISHPHIHLQLFSIYTLAYLMHICTFPTLGMLIFLTVIWMMGVASEIEIGKYGFELDVGIHFAWFASEMLLISWA